MLSAVQPLGSTKVVCLAVVQKAGPEPWPPRRCTQSTMEHCLSRSKLGSEREGPGGRQRTQNAEMQDVDLALVPRVRAML
jgi:hypothetical protein